MEKQRLRKKIKGLSLISLTIAVVILIIISSLLIYNAKNGVKIRAYKMLQNDVQLLEDKVNAYYVKYSAIPAEIEYKNTTLLDRMFNESEKSPNDGEEYYVIDLKALEGVTLNYGKDYENISTEDDTRKYEDVYIINKESHHIYYVKGINFDGKWYYTNENDDEVNVVERKKWVSAVDGGNRGEICALDNRGTLYTTTTDYEGKINENRNYQKLLNVDELKLSEKNIVQISAGIFHTVALDEEGKVYTWGDNGGGQPGDGTTTNSVLPICLSDKDNELKGKRIVDISAGGIHTVAIDEEGKAYTWGNNEFGQLGDGTTTNSVLPICISDKDNELKGKKIISISAGGYHTVAIDKEGKVYTWGDNEVGQLGDGTANDFVAPIYSAEPICLTDKENELKRMKTVKVVAAIIRDGNKVFATQRGYGDYKDGWEFPGGKVEPGETAQQALAREIKEELDTDIAVGDYLTTIEYAYPTFHLSMQCFWCRIVDGTPVLKEHEAARWLDVDHIDSVEWLPADLTIIDLIKDKMVGQVALEILQEHKAAFEKLAKQ